MIGLIIVLSIVLYVLYRIWKRFQVFKLRDKMGLKGPETSFIYGNLKQIMNFKPVDRKMLILNQWRKKYGDVYGYYFGARLTVLVADVDLAKEILIKKFDCFVNRMVHVFNLPSPNCFSLVNLEGDHWKTIRHGITPTFTASKMKQMAYIINQKIDTLMNKMEEQAKSGETFDIYNDFQALTLDVIGQCAFAVNVHCQTNESDPFLLDVKKVFNLIGVKEFPLMRLAVILPEFRYIFSMLRRFSKLSAVEKRLTGNLEKVVERRKEELKVHGSVDVLQLLLEQQANTESDSSKEWKLTDPVIVGNAYVFLLAGYETTSTALGFTAWLLAKHQDVQKRLQAEIDEKLAKLAKEPLVDYDFVNKLPYMDAVFHESLRILPPVIEFVQRTCVKECYVGGIKFEPGVQVHIPVHEIHHDPNIWPEPEKFDPERFLNNKDYASTAWLPFGAGPRNCIGMRFADMEYKMALSRLLHDYTIIFAPDSEDPLNLTENSLLLRPKNGIRIRLEKRFNA